MTATGKPLASIIALAVVFALSSCTTAPGQKVELKQASLAKPDPNNDIWESLADASYTHATDKDLLNAGNGLSVHWTGYAASDLSGGVAKPFNRLQLWMEGLVTSNLAIQGQQLFQADLLALGAQNRKDYLYLRVVDGSGSTPITNANLIIDGKGNPLPQYTTSHGVIYYVIPASPAKQFYLNYSTPTSNGTGSTIKLLVNFGKKGANYDHHRELDDGGGEPGDPSDLN